MNYSDLPKIELHLHLDCSLSYRLARRLDPRLDEERFRDTFIAPPKCLDLPDYLTRAQQGIRLMQEKEQLQLVTLDLLDQLQADRVIYAEIRFAPLLHTDRGLLPGEVVETVLEALQEGARETKTEARLLLCTLREYSEAQSMETVQLVEAFRGAGVVGFDIAGDEANFPLEAHKKAFRFAQERGIQTTAHAGEARGADSIWETIQYFSPRRIGHGVRSIEDERLVEHLVENKIHLEVCPTSNIQTNVFGRYNDHPIHTLQQAGISVGVNTDGRTISNITLSEEYQKIARHFNWGPQEFLQCNLDALEAAFVEENVKKILREKLIKSY